MKRKLKIPSKNAQKKALADKLLRRTGLTPDQVRQTIRSYTVSQNSAPTTSLL